MTPKLYETRKQAIMHQIPTVARSYVNVYFDMLKGLNPMDVVDAIESGKTIQQAYKELGINPLRLGIAAARGFLKISKNYQEKLKEIATLELALTTLQFENPNTYAVIQRYGDKGKAYLQNWVQGALEILGVN